MVSVIQARVSTEIEFKAFPYFSGLAHTRQLLFENGDFFSLVYSTLHTCLVETVTKNASFQKRFPEWRFLKTPFCCTGVDGWNQTITSRWLRYHFKMRLLPSKMVPFRESGHAKWFDATCGRECFWKRGKVFKQKRIPSYVGQCLSLLQVFNTG